MSYSPLRPRTLTLWLLVACLIPNFILSAEAKGRKAARIAAHAKSKGGQPARAARAKGRSTRRSLARHNRRERQRDTREDYYQEAAAPQVVPDRVEVLEYGAASSADLSRWLNMPAPRVALSHAFADIEAVAATRRHRVNIEPARALAIQQALASRGFYAGEMTGVYDDATIEAMRRFQASSRIAVTGYPTAHALKRLGLGEW